MSRFALLSSGSARAAFVLLSLLSSGCYSMTIVNGQPPAPQKTVDDAWRSSAVLDIVPIDTPLLLDAACKETGWAVIEQNHSALDWLVDVFLAGGIVYESTHVNVQCARGAAPPGQVPSQAPPAAPSGPAPAPTTPPSTSL